jgi:3-phenylpropionate/cinnamic acid dioxygenase small subunit
VSAGLTRADAEALLAREGHYLDTRQWDAWLDLFTEDVVFWVPAWKSEDEPTEDPDRELSLIYDVDRAALVDRVWRLRSGMSVASTPLQRTAHQVSTVVLAGSPSATEAEVRASFAVHCFNPANSKAHTFFGLYEHTLRREGEAWKIARKKVLVLNDLIPTVMDVYMI